MMMQEVLRDTLVEIDLKKLANNMRLIRQLVGPDTAITAVVKANAYGHGAVGIAETLMESGADYLAVATLSEAVEIKKLTQPIRFLSWDIHRTNTFLTS